MSQSIEVDLRESFHDDATTLHRYSDRGPEDPRSDNGDRRLKANPMCEVHNGIPVIRGIRSGYYHFDHKGKRRLVLTRKQRDSLLINGAVNIVVLEIKDDEITLGIVCPDDTVIHCNDISVGF